MNEQHLAEELRRNLAVLRRRGWLLATTVTVSLLAATVYNFATRPLFQASAQILIERDLPDVLPGKDLVEPAGRGADYLNTQYHLLAGRALAERVVAQLGLQRQAEFMAGPRLSPWERLRRRFLGEATPPQGAPEAPAAPAVAAFRSRLRVEPVPNTTLVALRFSAYDPVLAALVVNTLAQAYIEQSMEFRYTTSSEATGWLSDRLKDQQAKLEEAERRLQEYRERAGLVNLEERRSMIDQKLTALTGAAMTARTERINKETLYRQMRALPPAELATFPLMMADKSLQDLRAQLSDRQREQLRLGETMGDKHPDMIRVKNEIRALEARIATQVQNIVDGVETEYKTAQQQEQNLQANLDAIRQEAFEINRKAIEYGVLKREVDSHQQLFDNLMTRSKETGLQSELKATNIRVVERAEIPSVPISPRRLWNYQLALLLGLGLGLALVFVAEQLDNTIKNPDDVRDLLGLPFLGMVADVSPRRRGLPGTTSPLTFLNPRSALAESFKVIRTNLIFSWAEARGRVLVVTSVNPGEGKSTTAANVAFSLAQNGARVLLLEGDLRRPTIHQTFGTSASPGLSDLIVGKAALPEAVHPTATPHLDVVACGYVPPNPAELLGSSAMSEVLTALRERYDWVLVDTPPVLGMADTPVLCRAADGVILVISSEQTARPSVARAVEQINSVGGRVVGVVLNRADVQRHSYYFGQYYGDYYRQLPAESAPPEEPVGADAGPPRLS